MTSLKTSFLNKANAATSSPDDAQNKRENKARHKLLIDRIRASYTTMRAGIDAETAKAQQPVYDAYEAKLAPIIAERTKELAVFAQDAEAKKEEARLGMQALIEQYDAMLERGESLPLPDTVIATPAEQERKREAARLAKRKQRENFEEYAAATQARLAITKQARALEEQRRALKRPRTSLSLDTGDERSDTATQAAARATIAARNAVIASRPSNEHIDPADGAAYAARAAAAHAEDAAARAVTPKRAKPSDSKEEKGDESDASTVATSDTDADDAPAPPPTESQELVSDMEKLATPSDKQSGKRKRSTTKQPAPPTTASSTAPPT